MRNFLIIIFFSFFYHSVVFSQPSLSRTDHKRILEGIKTNYEAANYQAALDSCVYLVDQKFVHPDDGFMASYFASAISIYNGNHIFAEYFISLSKDFYLLKDTVSCNQSTMYRLLRAEYLLESGKYQIAKDSLNNIKENLEGCDQKWRLITYLNYYRTSAGISDSKSSDVKELVTIAIDSLEQISNYLVKDKNIPDRWRLRMYTELYLAELYWKRAWLNYASGVTIINKAERGDLIAADAKKALGELNLLDRILVGSKDKRLKLLSKILRAQILGHIQLRGEPISSPVLKEVPTFEPQRAMSILLDCQAQEKDFKIFKEYSYMQHLTRQLILMYWQYCNEIKYGKNKYMSLEAVLSELYPKSRQPPLRAIYGNLPAEALLDASVLRYPSYDAIARENNIDTKEENLDTKERALEDLESDLDARYNIFWGILLLLLLPFIVILLLGFRFARQSAKIRKKDAELEAALHLMEEIKEDQGETSEELGVAKNEKKIQVYALEQKIAQKEEDIKHLKMELSHRLVNQLLYLSNTIESDLEDENVDRNALATKAIGRLKNAIKLQRILEDYDSHTSIYFPTYFDALQEVANGTFNMSIKLDCDEFGVEKQVPYSFARDLGQLIIEWLFLLAGIPVNQVRILATPSANQLKLSIIVSEDDWKKMGSPKEFSAVEQGNSKIAGKIAFYLRKYQPEEATFLKFNNNKGHVSLNSTLHF